MLRIGKISKEIIADLCRSDVRPDGWLSHTVYVEEVGEDEKLGDMPFISFLMRILHNSIDEQEKLNHAFKMQDYTAETD